LKALKVYDKGNTSTKRRQTNHFHGTVEDTITTKTVYYSLIHIIW